MVKTFRRITRSGLAERLGLFGADLNPRRGSTVSVAHTEFRNAEGEILGTHTVRFNTISGGWDHDFHIVAASVEPEEDYAAVWL